MTTGKTVALTRRIFVSKVMSLLFNTLSRFVIAFLPRSKCLRISRLQSGSAVILELKKILLSKFESASNILSFVLSTLWNILESSINVIGGRARLTSCVTLSTIFLKHVDKSLSLNSSACPSKVLNSSSVHIPIFEPLKSREPSLAEMRQKGRWERFRAWKDHTHTAGLENHMGPRAEECGHLWLTIRKKTGMEDAQNAQNCPSKKDILLHVNYTSVNLTLKRPETHFHCLDFRDRSLSGKESACQCRRCKRRRFNPWVREIPLEEEMAAHSSILAWEIPWTEEPGGLQSMESRRVGHNWAAKQYKEVSLV